MFDLVRFVSRSSVVRQSFVVVAMITMAVMSLILAGCNSGPVDIGLVEYEDYYIDMQGNEYEEDMVGQTPVLKKRGTNQIEGVWDTNENMYVKPGQGLTPPKRFKLPEQDSPYQEVGFSGFIIDIGGSHVIDVVAGDAADAKAILESFAAFVESDQDLSYDVSVAESLSDALDFSSVSWFSHLESKCSAAKSQIDQLTAPQECSDFQDDLSFLLGRPSYIVNPDYIWANNAFDCTLNGNQLDISVILNYDELLDITLTKNGEGEVTLSGTVGGMSVSTPMQAHPILIFRPLIDEAYEWGYERTQP